jgi:hypothetical protein
MIVKKKNQMYTSKRTMVYGSGFLDTLKDIGSYILRNKDLLAKPMLSAVGEIGGLALTEASKALINKLTTDKKKKELDPNSKQILERLTLGSGIKRF